MQDFQFPSAQTLHQQHDTGVTEMVSKERQDIEKAILDAHNRNQTNISLGYVFPQNVAHFKTLGYKVESGFARNENWTSINW
jgi:hypothetical protein